MFYVIVFVMWPFVYAKHLLLNLFTSRPRAKEIWIDRVKGDTKVEIIKVKDGIVTFKVIDSPLYWIKTSTGEIKLSYFKSSNKRTTY